jgi:hypothetical protein
MKNEMYLQRRVLKHQPGGVEAEGSGDDTNDGGEEGKRV